MISSCLAWLSDSYGLREKMFMNLALVSPEMVQEVVSQPAN